ncbi:MAG: transporter [Ruminococcus sp.]|nr:transporter [Ruminococcus sp.]
MDKSKSSIRYFLLLHILFMIYSFCSVCSKSAAGYSFLSKEFILFYGLEILLLVIYAVGWQQILKNMPLSSAFSYKGITIIWALIWGKVFFGENLTFNKALGALLVISGIVLYAYGDRENE